MRVAIVHYWLVSMRGGERVLESLCRMFPDADVFMHVYDPSAASSAIARHRVRTSFVGRLPFARRLYQRYLPLMPMALEALDLTGYDLVISHEAGPAKGIVPSPDAVHVCYASSPMRYVWDRYHVYRAGAGRLARLAMLPVAHYLRVWDESSAARVDRFMANSSYVQRRVRKFYRRDSDVVHPPVAVDAFAPARPEELGDYYLWAGELVSYKRPDVAVEAFRRSGRPLVVIGDGAELARLKHSAPPNIRFLGKVGFGELKYHMARCRALVFPGDEDFGIVPVEVQASGRPVVAWRKGGVLDTVIDGETGVLFDECSAAALNGAIDALEANPALADPTAACVRNASRFGERAFRQGVLRCLERAGLADAARHAVLS